MCVCGGGGGGVQSGCEPRIEVIVKMSKNVGGGPVRVDVNQELK